MFTLFYHLAMIVFFPAHPPKQIRGYILPLSNFS